MAMLGKGLASTDTRTMPVPGCSTVSGSADLIVEVRISPW